VKFLADRKTARRALVDSTWCFNRKLGLPFSASFARFLANVNSCSCSLYVVVRPSVVCLSVTFVHPTQPIEIFGNVSVPCNTLVTWQLPGKILRRSSQGNPSVGGLNQRVIEKFSDFGPLRFYISETTVTESSTDPPAMPPAVPLPTHRLLTNYPRAAPPAAPTQRPSTPVSWPSILTCLW